MAYIKQEDILGYSSEGSVVCSKCITAEEEKRNFKEEDIFTEDRIEEGDFCFCDRCHIDLREVE